LAAVIQLRLALLILSYWAGMVMLDNTVPVRLNIATRGAVQRASTVWWSRAEPIRYDRAPAGRS